MAIDSKVFLCAEESAKLLLRHFPLVRFNLYPVRTCTYSHESTRHGTLQPRPKIRRREGPFRFVEAGPMEARFIDSTQTNFTTTSRILQIFKTSYSSTQTKPPNIMRRIPSQLLPRGFANNQISRKSYQQSNKSRLWNRPRNPSLITNLP
jgi:hypothetical protein